MKRFPSSGRRSEGTDFPHPLICAQVPQSRVLAVAALAPCCSAGRTLKSPVQSLVLRPWGTHTHTHTHTCPLLGQQVAPSSLDSLLSPPPPPNVTGEERRIREFYQSRGLERGSQAGHEDPASDRVGLPYTTFDHSRAHYYRFDEHVTLCLEKQSTSGKEKSKHVLQQKYVRCSVRAQIRHLRRVLCYRLELALQYVQILFDNEVLPDHLTLKQLWLSRWFGKPAPLHLNYSVKEKRR
ncbi:polycomb group RING finger protein 1 [Notechis scutatus]|uniref:Polycomb group RING finger protein 1 n=1 Tax=Notechis scutatus TaxID=8663 RepID=A0A6J1UXE2_9SAUR|nr:polycomb group RING finger protein 1 [Notechis scutatus]